MFSILALGDKYWYFDIFVLGKIVAMCITIYANFPGYRPNLLVLQIF